MKVKEMMQWLSQFDEEADVSVEIKEEGEFELHLYKCPNCGLTEEVYLPEDEEKPSYPAYNGEECSVADCEHGYHGLCPECGCHIIWGADFMRSEVWGDIPLTPDNEKKLAALQTKIDNIKKQIETSSNQNEKDTFYATLIELQKEVIDVEYEGIDENEDSLAPSVSCPHCGASIQLVYPMTSEQKKYPFYTEK